MMGIEWIDNNGQLYLNLKTIKPKWGIGVAVLIPKRDGYVHTLVIDGINHDAYTPYLLGNAKMRLLRYIAVVHRINQNPQSPALVRLIYREEETKS